MGKASKAKRTAKRAIKKKGTVRKLRQKAVNGAVKVGRRKLRRAAAASSASGPTVPRVMSAVSDGINTGMVWKNSNSVADFFAPRFEKVTDLTIASNVFTILQSYFLNPGNITLFPVFSQIAATYEEYVCHRLRFWYRGLEYTASGSNTSAGVMIYATNMDPDDSQFTSTSQMENYEGSISGPPFTGHFMHDVAQVHMSRGRNRSRGPGLALNNYFVYSSANTAAPSGSTAKFYDMGQFQIASQGAQNASPAGELWVEHSWTMIRRKQETPIGQASLYAHIVEGPAGSAAASGSAFLGTTGGILRGGSTLPCVSTKSTYTIPVAGTYLVAHCFTGSVTGGCGLSLGANITAVQIQADNGSGTNDAANGSNNTVSVSVYNVAASGTGAANTVTLSVLTSLASGTADIFIAQVSGGILEPRGPSGKDEIEVVDMYRTIQELSQRLRLLEHGNTIAVSEEPSPTEQKGNGLEKSIHVTPSRLAELVGSLTRR